MAQTDETPSDTASPAPFDPTEIELSDDDILEAMREILGDLDMTANSSIQATRLGQSHPHQHSAQLGAPETERPAIGFDHVAHDRQSQPSAGLTLVEPQTALAESRPVRGRDAWAVIGDPDLDLSLDFR